MERPNFKFKGLDHLAMKVRDLEKSLEFYVGLLGWRVNDGKNNSGFFGRPNRFVSCTDRHHTINMFEFRPKDGSCDPPVGNTQDNDQYGDQDEHQAADGRRHDVHHEVFVIGSSPPP